MSHKLQDAQTKIKELETTVEKRNHGAQRHGTTHHPGAHKILPLRRKNMVKNKHIIIKKLIYYGILQYLVMGAIFAFMYTPIFEWCCLSLKLRENSSLYPLIQYGLMAFLAAFWIYLFLQKYAHKDINI